MKILVIEDSTLTNIYMSKYLSKKIKATVDSAFTAEQALQFLDNCEYDFILCDIELPEMTGPEILLSKNLHNAKVYFCSALDNMREKLAPCFAAGMNIVGQRLKPVFSEELSRMVHG